MSSTSEQSGLPNGWEVRFSKTRQLPYYFNAESSASVWEPPEGTETEKLKAYMTTVMPKLAGEQTGGGRGGGASAGSGGGNEGKIRAAHLLVKHKESRRASSWKESNITRSKEEAQDILKRHEENIKSGNVSLGKLAETESDCSSARKKGDLGFFGRGEMQKEFEEAAFALQPGEMSGIVETASGYHLIERIS